MSDCLVLIGASRAEQEEIVGIYKKERPGVCVVSHESMRKQLYGKKEGKNLQMEKNLLYDKIYSYLAQGKDVIFIDGPLRAIDRKRFVGYMSKVEDAKISCVSFEDSIKNYKDYQLPTIDEGWHGIAKFRNF